MVVLPHTLITRFAYSAIQSKTIDRNQYFALTLIKRVSLEAHESDQNRAKNGLALAHYRNCTAQKEFTVGPNIRTSLAAEVFFRIKPRNFFLHRTIHGRDLSSHVRRFEIDPLISLHCTSDFWTGVLKSLKHFGGRTTANRIHAKFSIK